MADHVCPSLKTYSLCLQAIWLLVSAQIDAAASGQCVGQEPTQSFVPLASNTMSAMIDAYNASPVHRLRPLSQSS